MLDLWSYQTLHRPIRCVSGVVADAANGRRLIYDKDNGYVPTPEDDPRPKTVWKKTEKPVYTAVYKAEDNGISYHVLEATEINKHGLKWREIYQCTAHPDGEIEEYGANGIGYWLNGEGQNLLEDGLLQNFGAHGGVGDYLRKFPAYGRICELFKHLHTDNTFQLFLKNEYSTLAFRATHPLGLPFGVELEFTGLYRRLAARIVAKCLGTTSTYVGGPMHEHHIVDQKGRIWKIVRDGSIVAELKRGSSSPDVCKCELVTPICYYFDDINSIKKVICTLREYGMVVNSSCGLHVHVDLKSFSGRPLKNLVNIMSAREDLLFSALNVHRERKSYCQKLEPDFVDRLNSKDFWMTSEIGDAWNQICPGRYHALNLSSLFSRNKGIEFRCFNSTTSEIVVEAYVQLALSMCMQAYNQERALPYTYSTASERQQFRSWMMQMNMKGRDFTAARGVFLPELSDEAPRRHRSA